MSAALSYVDKLNISTIGINEAKKIIKKNILNTLECWKQGKRIEKQTFHLIGAAGIGKTQICSQLAAELSDVLKVAFQCLTIKCPVLNRDDFLVPFPEIKEKVNRFRMLYSDFVPEDPDSFGLYVIDEFSRGDHPLQQLMWQIQNENKIHLQDLPQGWFVIALDNPDDQEYSMDTMEDAAGLRRMLHLYVSVDVKDFLDYAKAADFHPLIIEFIQAYPEFLYDFESQKLGRVYANPASYERLSNILWGYELGTGILENLREIEHLASGLLNISKARLFIDFLKAEQIIKPRDILENYPNYRKAFLKWVTDEDVAKLSQAMLGFVTFLCSEKPPNLSDKLLNNIATFLYDVPSDVGALFITEIDKYERLSAEYKYMTQIHKDLKQKNGKYKEFLKNLSTIANRGS